MVAAASTAASSGQFTAAVGMAVVSSRSSAANAPILGTVVMNAATGGELPSVTSGTQKWPGTAPALNSRPASTAIRPAVTAPCGGQDDDADGAGGDVDDVAGPEVGGGGLSGGQGRGSQPGQAGRGGHRADQPLPVAGQPGAGQQPGDRADGQDDLGGERAEVLVH